MPVVMPAVVAERALGSGSQPEIVVHARGRRFVRGAADRPPELVVDGLGQAHAAQVALPQVLVRIADALPALGLSKENQRALPIVADLYRRIGGGEMEADPVTAAACLEDARSFLGEVEKKLRG